MSHTVRKTLCSSHCGKSNPVNLVIPNNSFGLKDTIDVVQSEQKKLNHSEKCECFPNPLSYCQETFKSVQGIIWTQLHKIWLKSAHLAEYDSTSTRATPKRKVYNVVKRRFINFRLPNKNLWIFLDKNVRVRRAFNWTQSCQILSKSVNLVKY